MLRAIINKVLSPLGMTEDEERIARESFIGGSAQAAGAVTAITTLSVARVAITALHCMATTSPLATAAIGGMGYVIYRYTRSSAPEGNNDQRND
jgi:hypothetical protein